jgi:oligoribonuclease (3'-5' exoribonuclease)
MLNEVTKIFSDMTDEELVLVIDEMREDDPLGIIRENGIVRSKCKMVHDIVGGNTYEHLMMVQVSILREAAYRFTPTMDELTHNV